MNAGVERFLYRVPFWRSLISFFLIGLCGGFYLFVALKADEFSLSALAIAGFGAVIAALGPIGFALAFYGRAKNPQVVLTETAITVPRAYRPARRIAFADVDRLHKIMFRSVAEFDHVVASVVRRVAMRGGPDVLGAWPLPPR